jgi:hypothetical protein
MPAGSIGNKIKIIIFIGYNAAMIASFPGLLIGPGG